MEYLTPNDYKTAEQNGISKHNANQRFYVYDWSVERTITEPLKSRTDVWNQYKDKSVVSLSTFRRRLKNGMSPELAASTPTDKGEKLCKANIQRAEKNGICMETLKARIYSYHWSVEKAVTFPVDVQKRKKCNA